MRSLISDQRLSPASCGTAEDLRLDLRPRFDAGPQRQPRDVLENHRRGCSARNFHSLAFASTHAKARACIVCCFLRAIEVVEFCLIV